MIMAGGFAADEGIPLKKEEGNHFALKNVHERLRLKFGQDCGLEIESVPGTGTLVTIWLPDSR